MNSQENHCSLQQKPNGQQTKETIKENVMNTGVRDLKNQRDLQFPKS